jgi:hypothetical protein
MNGDDGVLAIVLAAEHLLRLAGFDLADQFIEAAREILGHRLPRLRPFDQHREIVDAPAQRFTQVAVLFEAAAPLQQLLGAGLIFPEVGVGDPQLYAGELVGGAGCVKDSSADRTRVWRGPDTGGAARRVEWWPYGRAVLF